MAKKKGGQPRASGTQSPSSAADDATTTISAIKSTAQLFAAMQSKSSQWYEKERAGIALLEGFQTALNACRDELTANDDANALAKADNQQSSVMTALTGLGGNSEMDPLLAEELFAQVKELKHGFDELLQGMYDLHCKARQLGMERALLWYCWLNAGLALDVLMLMCVVLAASSANEEAVAAGSLTLAPIDYYQFIGHELAAYEAEYQHVVRT